jgi:hypothetical protein
MLRKILNAMTVLLGLEQARLLQENGGEADAADPSRRGASAAVAGVRDRSSKFSRVRKEIDLVAGNPPFDRQ